ncbi:MAG: SusD/RagB family nutrient-binding outer membrane lipoprotein [Longimicrobiales bacterium]
MARRKIGVRPARVRGRDRVPRVRPRSSSPRGSRVGSRPPRTPSHRGSCFASRRSNTQYWIASFLIPDEAWANFRGSGYPQLAPNPLRGSLQTEAFMRRFGYPDAERTVNPNTASQGVTPDNLDTRVWWDANDGR